MRPKVIKTEAEYEAALARVDALMDAPVGSPEEEELELWSVLVERYEDEHYPIDLPDPIEAIKFRMEQQGLTRKDMRQYLGSASRVSEVLSGKRRLSLTMIRKLHDKLGIPAEVLLREPGRTKVQDCEYRMDEYPFNEMYKRGYFGAFEGSLRQAKEYGEELLQSLFAVFGGRTPQPIYCRMTEKPFQRNALIAWQARALQIALADDVPPFSPDALTSLFAREVVHLSCLEEGPRLVGEYLGKRGIHFVVLQHLPHTNLDGASFYTPDGNPVVALTLRYDRADNFWFTLAHELGHVILHLSQDREHDRVFFDEIDAKNATDGSSQEIEANRYAREALIPSPVWERERARLTTASAIRRFADQLGISPAIVAGRVQWEAGDYRKFRQLVASTTVRRFFPHAFAAG